jgi:hypothetical protein
VRLQALHADVAAELLPDVEDDQWSFDTELLVLAARRGLRVHEVPVDWVDDPDSRVRILRTATQDIRGVVRMRRQRCRSDAAPEDRRAVADRSGRVGR